MQVEGNNPDPLFIKLWNRIKENPKKYTVGSYESFLSCMSEPKNYGVSTDDQMTQMVFHMHTIY